jgi:signal transduction histidine kinase
VISRYQLTGREHGLVPRGLVASSNTDSSPSGFVSLLRKVIEGTAADVAWLTWPRRACATVFSAAAPRSAFQLTFENLPPPPAQSLLITPQADASPWAEWCLGQGFQSGAIATFGSGKAIGTIGLLGTTVGILGLEELRRLELAAWLPGLAATGRRQAAAGTSRLLDPPELLRALGIDRLPASGSTYLQLEQALESSLDVTCWTLAIREGHRLRVKASGGRRPAAHVRGEFWPLAEMPHCAAALRDWQAVVMEGEPSKMRDAVEHRQLFSAGTSAGAILPFGAGPGVTGVLIVGEERVRSGLLSSESLARLELVALRVGDLVQLARLVSKARALERRRLAGRAESAERQRLSRELHDGVGQALTALLARTRWAMDKGVRGDDLEVLEAAAQKALDATRELVGNLRTPDTTTDPLEEARRYAETTLRDVGCKLTWEDRTARRAGPGVSREVAQVIKESITNIVRHAGAQHVRVTLTAANRRMLITVRDDGVGVTSANETGNGLLANAERMAKIGGTFEIRKMPQGGTVVVGQVDLR